MFRSRSTRRRMSSRTLACIPLTVLALAGATTTAHAYTYWQGTCNVNNGVYCKDQTYRANAYSASTMRTIPSAINEICAGGFKTDGSSKNGSRCKDWNQGHDVTATFDAPNIVCQAWGRWRGGGAPNILELNWASL
jgi:hypothetical protein